MVSRVLVELMLWVVKGVGVEVCHSPSPPLPPLELSQPSPTNTGRALNSGVNWSATSAQLWINNDKEGRKIH